MVAWWTGGAWVLYFADAPTLVYDLATLRAPFVAYLWIGILTFTTYTLAGLCASRCASICARGRASRRRSPTSTRSTSPIATTAASRAAR